MIDDSELIHSGFVTVVGRPNVGKSTLVNRIVGTKVSIVSDKPQTTRMQVRGVLNRPDAQIVFVDTPGLHKPRTALGERTNASAVESIGGVDVVVFVLDASGPIGRGDNFVSEMLPRSTLCVLNKIDGLSEDKVLSQLARAGEYGFEEYFPISARTGRGVKTLVDHIVASMPPGPAHYPIDSPSDMAESVWVAELVREQLLRLTHDELPHSITTRVTEWEWPRIRVEILVERDSQKGIAIGKNGAMLKAVGTAVRQKMPPGAFLELHVKLEKDWQRRGNSLDRLGF
ncbi:MAG TPA: GTPase Era [Acidimicrobiales bacterium]|nr:GTPase Era [Acidimicrobiales bacterium]